MLYFCLDLQGGEFLTRRLRNLRRIKRDTYEIDLNVEPIIAGGIKKHEIRTSIKQEPKVCKYQSFLSIRILSVSFVLIVQNSLYNRKFPLFSVPFKSYFSNILQNIIFEICSHLFIFRER